MNAYTKTKSGEWVVIGLESDVAAGATVTVTKRGGETKSESIDRTGSPFVAKFGPLKGQRVVYGHIAKAGATSKRSKRQPGTWTGCSCGSRESSSGDLIFSKRNCSGCNHDSDFG